MPDPDRIWPARLTVSVVLFQVRKSVNNLVVLIGESSGFGEHAQIYRAVVNLAVETMRVTGVQLLNGRVVVCRQLRVRRSDFARARAAGGFEMFKCRHIRFTRSCFE